MVEAKLQKLGRSTMKWKACQCQLGLQNLQVTQGRVTKPIVIRRIVQVMGGMAAFEIFEDATTDTVFGLEAVGSDSGDGTDALKWHTFRALPGHSIWVWKKWLREVC